MNMRSTRRTFLTATAAAGAWMGARTLAADAPKAGPNDTISLGVIGCGTEGRALIGAYQQCPGVRIAAVCDVNSEQVAASRQQAGGDKIFACSDFRKLLDLREIDAVVIATPGHWHTLPIIHACQAGKDVYVEKPLATTVAEGRAAVRAARKYDRIVQIGTQQHSWPHYIEAVNLIRSGALGEISEVKIWDYDYLYPGFGCPPDSEPPPEIDWEMYLGPAPKASYNVNRYLRHEWFFDYGWGFEGGWGVHHNDIVHWAMGGNAPVAATAMGGFFAFDKTNVDYPDTFDAVLEYPPGPVAKKGFLVQYTFRGGCRRDQVSHAKCFLGSDASLLLHRGGYTLTPETRRRARYGLAAERLLRLSGYSMPPAATERSGDKLAETTVANAFTQNTHRQSLAAHAKVFLESMRTRKLPPTDVEVGHRSTTPGHLMNIAWRVGRKIRWDAEKEQIVDDPQANALLTRNYRAPWKLEV